MIGNGVLAAIGGGHGGAAGRGEIGQGRLCPLERDQLARNDDRMASPIDKASRRRNRFGIGDQGRARNRLRH